MNNEDILLQLNKPLLHPGETTYSYLRDHREDFHLLQSEEKALQRAIIQAAAANGTGFEDILSQAIGLLTRVQQKLKEANPQRSADGVNFTGQKLLNKQVNN